MNCRLQTTSEGWPASCGASSKIQNPCGCNEGFMQPETQGCHANQEVRQGSLERHLVQRLICAAIRYWLHLFVFSLVFGAGLTDG